LHWLAHANARKSRPYRHGDLAAKQALQASVDSIEHGSFLQHGTLEMMKAGSTYFLRALFTVECVTSGRMQLPPEVTAKVQAARAVH
jgi:imidazolonepropionase-like amidohydrolase